VMPTIPPPPRPPMEVHMQPTSLPPRPRPQEPSPRIPIRPIPSSPMPETIPPIPLTPTATLSRPPRTRMADRRLPHRAHTPLQVQQPHQATTLPRMAASTHCLSNPRLLRTPNREALATQVVGDSVPLLLRSYLDCCIRWSSLEIIFFPIYRSFSPHGVGHLNRKMDHA